MNSAGSVEGRERLRLFCALRLPDRTREQLAAWQQLHLLPGGEGRAVAPENLHVTLAFLGPVEQARVGEVVSALRQSAATAEVPQLAAVRYRESRTVGMIELSDAGRAAARLAATLQERLGELRLYRRERRRWLPHVTVLRFRTAPGLRPPPPELGHFGPSDAALYHSVLRSTGAQYEILESFALGG